MCASILISILICLFVRASSHPQTIRRSISRAGIEINLRRVWGAWLCLNKRKTWVMKHYPFFNMIIIMSAKRGDNASSKVFWALRPLTRIAMRVLTISIGAERHVCGLSWRRPGEKVWQWHARREDYASGIVRHHSSSSCDREAFCGWTDALQLLQSLRALKAGVKCSCNIVGQRGAGGR